MTNAIETTKREMYDQFIAVKAKLIMECPNAGDIGKYVELGKFESAMAAHLEQLRQQYEQMAATARERFETIQSLEQSGQDLTAKLSAMTEERDAIRNKLQAFEFANKSAGEFLIDALRKVKSQRKTIKALRKAQEARESVGATLHQSEDEAPRCSLCGGSGFVFTGHAAMTGNAIEKICVCKKMSAIHDQA